MGHFPPYAPQGARHRFYSNDADAVVTDFTGSYSDGEDGFIRVRSVAMAERLWANGGPLHPQEPLTFDAHLKEIVYHTTEAAAGAILAFWDEVKDYTCPCHDFTPCSGWTSDNQPSCAPPLPSPGRTWPDDNAAVLATRSTTGPLEDGALDPRPVSRADAVTRLHNWRAMAAAGVEKGVASLADFGRASWLVELGDDEGLTEESLEAVGSGLGELVVRYAETAPAVEVETNRAARVAVLEAGFYGGVATLLAEMGRTFDLVPLTFDPLHAAEEHDVLVIPSGGLYGTSGSDALRQRLAAYVEAGGTLLVMSQARSADLAAIPVPPGETLEGFGYLEDQHCWQDSVRLGTPHQLTAAADRERLSLPVDGFLVRWPATAQVLLWRAGTGSAAALAYPVGSGQVVVTASFEDSSRGNGSGSIDGRRLFADAVSWGLDPACERTRCRADEACSASVPATLRNLTPDPADTVEWTLVAPSSEEVVARWDEPLAVAPGETLDTSAAVSLPAGGVPGLYRLRYRLLDSARALSHLDGTTEPWVVQPAAEAGQLLVERWPESLAGQPALAVDLAFESELILNFSRFPLQVVVHNAGAEPFAGTVDVGVDPAPPWGDAFEPAASATVSVAPGETVVQDLTVGPFHLVVFFPDPFGRALVRASVTPEGGAGPVAQVAKVVGAGPDSFDVALSVAPNPVMAGSAVDVAATLSTAAAGVAEGRWKLAFVNEGSWGSSGSAETEWRPFTLAAGGDVTLADTLALPYASAGAQRATLYLCFPLMPCWASGDPEDTWYHAYPTTIAVEVPWVRLAFGDAHPSSPGWLDLPVRVTSTTPLPIAGARVRVASTGGEPWEQLSAPFDLAPQAELETTVPIPLDLATTLGRRVDLVARLSHPVWDLGFPDSRHRPSLAGSVRYDARVAVRRAFRAAAGAPTAAGTLTVLNRSSFPRSFALTLSAPDLGFSEQRSVECAAGAQVEVEAAIPVPAGRPYGSLPLEVRLDDRDGLVVERTVPVACDDPGVVLAATVSPDQPQAGQGLELRCDVAAAELGGPVDGTVALEVPALGVSEARAVTLAPGEPVAVAFAFDLPADVPAGDVAYSLRFREGGGSTYQVDADGAVTVVGPRFTAALAQDSLTAGEPVTYTVSNAGGVGGGVEVTWTLRGDGVGAGSGWTTVDLAAGETRPVGFAVNPSLAAGRYVTLAALQSADGSHGRVASEVDLDGVEATLEVATAERVFTLGEALEASATVVNGGRAFPGAQLHLEVVAARAPCPEMASWGVFQGEPTRRGSSSAPLDRPWGEPVNSLQPVASATTPPILATATGDLDGDGRDDLVAVGDLDGPRRLAWHRGPFLDQGSAVDLGPTSFTAVAVADADMDGSPEVLVASLDWAGLLEVHGFDNQLVPRFAASESLAPVGESPFPAGGPLVVDLEGDGPRELLVAGGSDLVALDAATGALRWRLSTCCP